MKSRNLPLARALTAATASSAALFALQHHTEAAIVYSGTQNVVVQGLPSQQVIKTFKVAGQTAFLNLKITPVSSGSYKNVLKFKLGSFMANGSGNLKKLAAGALISAAKFPGGHNGSALMASQTIPGGLRHGTWRANLTVQRSQTGFEGFKLSNGDLGWVRLNFLQSSFATNYIQADAIDWAYNNVAGQSINAGQEAGAAPEPSRALLALAGLGAMALRRKRKKAAD